MAWDVFPDSFVRDPYSLRNLPTLRLPLGGGNFTHAYLDAVILGHTPGTSASLARLAAIASIVQGLKHRFVRDIVVPKLLRGELQCNVAQSCTLQSVTGSRVLIPLHVFARPGMSVVDLACMGASLVAPDHTIPLERLHKLRTRLYSERKPVSSSAVLHVMWAYQSIIHPTCHSPGTSYANPRCCMIRQSTCILCASCELKTVAFNHALFTERTNF